MIEVLNKFSDAEHFRLKVHRDQRGEFTKLVHASTFRSHGWPIHWVEQYVSTSRPGVIRGLHFQVPPQSHAKLVICLDGACQDLALDLRAKSDTFGQHAIFPLRQGEGIFLPEGFAHGFYVPGPQSASLLYLTTTEYSPSHDSGILCESLKIDWPVQSAITSERDRSFVSLKDFNTPF